MKNSRPSVALRWKNNFSVLLEDFKNLNNLPLQLQELSKKQKTKENQSGKDERTGTRAGTRSSTRLQTRATTREMHSRDALCLPDICQTTTGRTYFQLFPPKPKPLHQWRDLKNRIRHDYNLVPLPYKEVDVVKRWLFCAFLLEEITQFYLFLNKKYDTFTRWFFTLQWVTQQTACIGKEIYEFSCVRHFSHNWKYNYHLPKKIFHFLFSTVYSFTAIWQQNSENEAG